MVKANSVTLNFLSRPIYSIRRHYWGREGQVMLSSKMDQDDKAKETKSGYNEAITCDLTKDRCYYANTTQQQEKFHII